MVVVMRGIVESERTQLACLDIGRTHRVAWVLQPDGRIIAALFALDNGRTGECLSRVEVGPEDVSRLSDALGAMAEGE